MEEVIRWVVVNKVEILSGIVGVITGGGLLTAWKYVSGAQNVNLSLQLEVRRTPSPVEGFHDLVCLLKLRKGDRATLRLETIVFFTKCESSGKQSHSVDLCVTAGGKTRKLNITPGEEAHFAIHVVIPSTEHCSISAEVTGRGLASRWAPVGIWRASEVSVAYLPMAKPKQPEAS
jgi:hypothetical protein